MYAIKRHASFCKLLFAFSLLFASAPIASQNLIPNPSFEETIPNAICERPDVSFGNLENWYSLNLNPDFFSMSCDFDEADFIYWDESNMASEGSNYIGLWSRWNSDQTYKTEGVAVELSSPLIAGETYLLEMKIINRGEFQGLTASCILKPRKHIDIYLSQDSIKIENNFADGSASTVATRAGLIQSEAITSEETEEWSTVSICFSAVGGEKFLGIILPLGDFGDLPDCAASMGTSGVFRSFYYFIDEVSLTNLSTDISADTLVCAGQEISVELNDIFDNEFLSEAEFEWDDGINGGFRVVTELRNYRINALTNCGNVPLALNVSTENCSSEIYFPNIFDPTLTDINSTFIPMNLDQNSITNYQFSIYDRWGSRIFNSTDPTLGWDGISQNRETPPGNYVWQISFETIELNERVKKLESGSFTLVR